MRVPAHDTVNDVDLVLGVQKSKILQFSRFFTLEWDPTCVDGGLSREGVQLVVSGGVPITCKPPKQNPGWRCLSRLRVNDSHASQEPQRVFILLGHVFLRRNLPPDMHGGRRDSLTYVIFGHFLSPFGIFLAVRTVHWASIFLNSCFI